ncbi:hypothetical protein BC833DRAFT_101425 [Globomyces pollinis-pini]|nr:hypothetical protein BC833DRAFT_101425 [Globomyces pollinis-pini]
MSVHLSTNIMDPWENLPFAKFLLSSRFCDAILRIHSNDNGSVDIPVHKIILASESDYFDRLFSNDLPVYEIQLNPHTAIQTVIEWIYIKQVRLSILNCWHSLVVANQLELDDLKDHICKWITTNIFNTHEDIKSIQEWFDIISLVLLADVSLDFIDSLVTMAYTSHEISATISQLNLDSPKSSFNRYIFIANFIESREASNPLTETQIETLLNSTSMVEWEAEELQVALTHEYLSVDLVSLYLQNCSSPFQSKAMVQSTMSNTTNETNATLLNSDLCQEADGMADEDKSKTIKPAKLQKKWEVYSSVKNDRSGSAETIPDNPQQSPTKSIPESTEKEMYIWAPIPQRDIKPPEFVSNESILTTFDSKNKFEMKNLVGSYSSQNECHDHLKMTLKGKTKNNIQVVLDNKAQATLPQKSSLCIKKIDPTINNNTSNLTFQETPSNTNNVPYNSKVMNPVSRNTSENSPFITKNNLSECNKISNNLGITPQEYLSYSDWSGDNSMCKISPV